MGNVTNTPSTSSSTENLHSGQCVPMVRRTSSESTLDSVFSSPDTPLREYEYNPRQYNRTKKSLIWAHVQKINNGVKCTHCTTFWPASHRQGSTSSVRKHQINFHWDNLSQDEKDEITEKSPKFNSKGKMLPKSLLVTYMNDAKSKVLSRAKYIKYDRKLARLFIRESLPQRLLDSEEFSLLL